MLKKTLTILIISILSLNIVACGEDVSKIETNEVVQSQPQDEVEIEKEVEEEKKENQEMSVYANLLLDEVWLKNNISRYETANKKSLSFLPLDINQDGTSEMLLVHEIDGLAGRTLRVISYENNEIKTEELSLGHSGFSGYFQDEKTFYIHGMQQGATWGVGYKFENGKCVKVHSFRGDEGFQDMEQHKYEIDQVNVSKEEYEGYYEKTANVDIDNYQFQEISIDNINKYLGVKLSEKISNSSDETDKVIGYGYIIPLSNIRYLTDNDVKYLSKEDLEYGRNEIFARHGYIFKTEKFKNYFSQKSWYKPNSSFNGSDSQLNEYEIANCKFIQSWEKK